MSVSLLDCWFVDQLQTWALVSDSLNTLTLIRCHLSNNVGGVLPGGDLTVTDSTVSFNNGLGGLESWEKCNCLGIRVKGSLQLGSTTMEGNVPFGVIVDSTAVSLS